MSVTVVLPLIAACFALIGATRSYRGVWLVALFLGGVALLSAMNSVEP